MIPTPRGLSCSGDDLYRRRRPRFRRRQTRPPLSQMERVSARRCGESRRPSGRRPARARREERASLSAIDHASPRINPRARSIRYDASASTSRGRRRAVRDVRPGDRHWCGRMIGAGSARTPGDTDDRHAGHRPVRPDPALRPMRPGDAGGDRPLGVTRSVADPDRIRRSCPRHRRIACARTGARARPIGETELGAVGDAVLETNSIRSLRRVWGAALSKLSAGG